MATITLEVTDDEARLIRDLAGRERVSVSEYLRRLAARTTIPPAKPDRVFCPHTGAMIFGPLPGHPPLTTEIVREMLADFP